MMDCKKALEEAGGDLDKAVELLRIKGMAKAEKRSGREASEGRIVAIVGDDAKSAAVIEVNSETDFVARNADFGNFAQQVAQHVFADTSLDTLVADANGHAMLNQPFAGNGKETLGEAVKSASAKTGENVVLRRVARFTSDGVIGSYVHFNGNVAVLVDVRGGSGAAARDLAKTIAEHVAAGVPTPPVGVTRDEVPEALIAKERSVAEAKAKESGKPDNIVQKMVEGQINKFFAEVTLLDQPWVRDPAMTIKQLVDAKSKEEGAALSVRRFARFQMGD
jgi:elongation factor Ts